MLSLHKNKPIFILGILVTFLSKAASSMEFSDDRCLKAYIFMHSRSEYSTDEKRSKDIQTVCADPTVSSIDFSLMELVDTDLDDIFEGLVRREVQPTGTGRDPLMLLNLSSDEITENGLKRFLQKLQKGEKVGGKKTIPDVRNTVFRIGFPISSEFGQELQAVAPSVFAGSLRLVY